MIDYRRKTVIKGQQELRCGYTTGTCATAAAKAAAVTAVVDECGSAAPSEMKRVILDRPFFYAIIEEETGIPLFMGTVERMH